jgi:rSAM/selenodomain-associated transferase 1
MTERLIVFLRAPRLGTVKTRLAAVLGDKAALDAYGQLVDLVLANVASFTAVQLRFTPDDAAGELEPWRRPGWQLRPQGPGDLGERLQRAFAEAFSSRATRVAVIGSDCPSVTGEDIGLAFAQLDGHDVVLGPASDGGYWLIALKNPQPLLFHEIPWSTSDVLKQTRKRADQLGLSTFLLRELTDIDTEKQWYRFLKSPASDRELS